MVYAAQFHSMGYRHESKALNKFTACDCSCPCCVFLKESLGSRGVSYYKDIPLSRLLAAMTLPGFQALALLMALTTQVLGCRGAALLFLLAVTSLRGLLGTSFSKKA
jgi:hypothetical protein